jgi:hypothetical protein
MPGVSKCKKCEARIIWVRTENDKNMPLDAKKVRIAVLDHDQAVVERYVEGHVPHWATCPAADDFRKQESLF